MCFDAQARDKKLLRLVIQDKLETLENEWVMPEYAVCNFIFYMPIPKSLPKNDRDLAEKEMLRHAKKPDVDNLCKLYLDVMTGLILQDDNCVSIGRALKIYSPNPRTVIFVQHQDKCISMRDLYG